MNLQVTIETAYKEEEKELSINCRILCALNEDPLECIENGKLRRDLYYRLSTFQIHIPPCGTGGRTFPPLPDVVLSELSKKLKRSITITQEARRCLALHDWPGNVRELRNVLEFSAYLSDNGAIVRDSLPEHIVPPRCGTAGDLSGPTGAGV